MRKSRNLAAVFAVATLAGVAGAQAAAKCTAYEQQVARQIKDGKAFLKQESFRKWIDDGLQSKAPYNKKPYTAYIKWYGQFDKLSSAKGGAEQVKFLEKYGFTASAAYSVIQGYALNGKLTSSVDMDFEKQMNAFPCL
ncbi:MAG: hypothetical protein J0I79_30305 [Mesorhizobium sp.]|uniref:hypothetical protein n=1 Tax=Mesorhizobium sp. TaxID=1871066 RepID=UPI001AD270C4|nr:hypothetical protein [Mesorhizobium sp.]MBN9222252.1 hypothetical protein [Mesorhizobium sp.]